MFSSFTCLPGEGGPCSRPRPRARPLRFLALYISITHDHSHTGKCTHKTVESVFLVSEVRRRAAGAISQLVTLRTLFGNASAGPVRALHRYHMSTVAYTTVIVRSEVIELICASPCKYSRVLGLGVPRCGAHISLLIRSRSIAAVLKPMNTHQHVTASICITCRMLKSTTAAATLRGRDLQRPRADEQQTISSNVPKTKRYATS